MFYSAASAPPSIGGAVFLIVPFLFGLGLFICGLRKERIGIRGLTVKLSLWIQIPLGLILLLVTIYSFVMDLLETNDCRMAVSAGEFERVSGPVEIKFHSKKPGNGYVEFTVGGRELKTWESGAQCDCGYIRPLGSTIKLKDGMLVEAKVRGRAVVELRVKNEG